MSVFCNLTNFKSLLVTLLKCFILGLITVESLVDGVNSPQMTFFTPPSHETIVHLESRYGYSATLKLTQSKSVNLPSLFPHLHTQNSTANREQKLTEFIVIGPDYPFHGVSAIIQQMNLRTNPENNGCKDFVQFAVNGSVSTRSQEICGTITKDEDWNNVTVTSDPRRQRTFFNPEGGLHLYLHFDQSSIDAHQVKASEGNEVGIEIVFTSYTVCPNPANSWKKLHACSSTDQMSCIYSTLFCDSKVDCGFPGEFGIDEQGCYIPYIYMALSISAGILLTVTLIYTFVSWVTKVPKEYR